MRSPGIPARLARSQFAAGHHVGAGAEDRPAARNTDRLGFALREYAINESRPSSASRKDAVMTAQRCRCIDIDRGPDFAGNIRQWHAFRAQDSCLVVVKMMHGNQNWYGGSVSSRGRGRDRAHCLEVGPGRPLCRNRTATARRCRTRRTARSLEPRPRCRHGGADPGPGLLPRRWCGGPAMLRCRVTLNTSAFASGTTD